MTDPGSDLAVDAAPDELVPVYRLQVTSTLKVALGQGRLTEDEYDERVAQAAELGSRAELATLLADLPVGRMNVSYRPPTSRDVRIGVGAIIVAAGVIATLVLTGPDNSGAFLLLILSAITLLVAPIVTVGIAVDVRRRKRRGGA